MARGRRQSLRSRFRSAGVYGPKFVLFFFKDPSPFKVSNPAVADFNVRAEIDRIHDAAPAGG